MVKRWVPQNSVLGPDPFNILTWNRRWSTHSSSQDNIKLGGPIDAFNSRGCHSMGPCREEERVNKSLTKFKQVKWILRRKNCLQKQSMTDRLGNSSAVKALKDTEMVMKPVCILAALKANGILDWITQNIAIRAREVILPLCLVLARPQDTQVQYNSVSP